MNPYKAEDGTMIDNEYADYRDAVTEETVTDLVEGANFIVVCPACDAEWVMGVNPLAYAALSNTYGPDALERRFERLRRDIPPVVCGTCLFRGPDQTGGES